MEAKFNEATINRPEGDRILDAPFVFTDIEKFSKQLKEEDAWHKNDRNGITVYKTSDFAIVLTWLHKDAVVMENVVDGLVMIQVIEGKIHFSIENGSTELVEKQIISIHAGIMHTIKALEDSLIMITTKGA